MPAHRSRPHRGRLQTSPTVLPSGTLMDPFALVLNAGSSSLKFCLFQQPKGAAWRVEARGQIEGIGTAPRMTVKDADGNKRLDQKLDAAIRDGKAAIDTLAGWLRSTFQGGRIVGVGHRVVHGGPRFSSPVVVTRDVLAELAALTPQIGRASCRERSGGLGG